MPNWLQENTTGFKIFKVKITEKQGQAAKYF